MADQDQTREATGRSEDGSAPPTQLPSTDSIQTRAPSSIPDHGHGFETPDDSISTRLPGGSTEDFDAPETSRLKLPPDAFPGYTLLEVIARGGMGVVYKAQQTGLNRPVALKVILGGLRASRKELSRFLVEAEAVAAIEHPHVVKVFEYGEADGRPFLAMELLPGNLTDHLKREGRLAPKPAAELLAKVTRAVQAAHDQGIVHRDLKPGNVLFNAQGEPKVTDFGLAKRETGLDHTLDHDVMGTPAYMSPEQAKGESKFVGPQADVYALGVILYECLTARRPFFDPDTHVLLLKVIHDEPDRPTLHVPGLPRDLELITLKCLAKDPAERYPTAQALANDLAHFAAGEPVSVRAASTIERALKWARRKPTQAAAYALSFAVVILLAFGASLAVLWWQAEGARETAEIAKVVAETAQKAEEKARSEAEIAHEKLTRVEYGRTIQVAHQDWRDNHIPTSRILLDSTQSDLRGWEWKYVSRLCHSELLEMKGHTNWVSSVSWSPDGSRIATASSDNTARVWDARSVTAVLILNEHAENGYAEKVVGVSWSPDGSRVATTGLDSMARVWDAKNGAEILTLQGEDSMTSAAWSPDGSRIASADHNGTMWIWDAKSSAKILTFGRHIGSVSSLSWSPDGSRIASAGTGETIQVWDPRSGAKILTLKGRATHVNSISWSPDGSRIASAGWDGMTQVWDAQSGAEMLALRAHTGIVTSVSWSPDGSRIATASSDSTARLWDARSGAEVPGLMEHTGYVLSVSWSPDGSRIATSGQDKTARVWDARTGAEVLALMGHTDRLTLVSWSPDGSRIATASSDSTARLWDARSGAEVLELPRLVLPVISASWSPDGSRIATTNGNVKAWAWDARTGEEVLELGGDDEFPPFRVYPCGITSVSWSPDGSRIATASADKTARVWDAKSGAGVLTLEGQTSSVQSMCWSPDGSRIATASSDNTAQVWDARNGAKVLTLKGHTSSVRSLTWSPDGSRIATASSDNTARVWDAKSGAEVLTLKNHTANVTSVSWSPDGSRIATACADGIARVWDSRSMAEVHAASR